MSELLYAVGTNFLQVSPRPQSVQNYSDKNFLFLLWFYWLFWIIFHVKLDRTPPQLVHVNKDITLILRIFFLNEAKSFCCNKIYVCNNLNTINVFNNFGQLFIKVKNWCPLSHNVCSPLYNFFKNFHFYIDPLPRRKVSEAPYLKQGNYPDPLSEMPRYCFPVQIFTLVFLVF